MDMVAHDDWIAAFTLAADALAAKRHDEQIKEFYKEVDREKETEHKREEKVEKEHKEAEEAIATAAQLAEFNARLDAYDTKIVERLMENREALDKVHDDLRRMHDDAYVLPDGRRVFKTADGRQVFDEQDNEVPRDVIDPAAISADKPTRDALKAKQGTAKSLLVEQDRLHEAHAKVEAAQDRAKSGDLTKKEMDGIDADLQTTMSRATLQKFDLAGPAADRAAMGRADDVSSVRLAATINETLRSAQPQPAPF